MNKSIFLIIGLLFIFGIGIVSALPLINISSPSGIVNYGKSGTELDLTYNISGANIDKVWYKYNGINYSTTKQSIYGYWSMNNTAGINATDSGQFYGNLTFNATPTWSAGKIGNAVNLGGKIYANISGLNQPDFSSSGFTLSLWVKNNTPWTTNGVIFTQDGGFGWYTNTGGFITGLGTTSTIYVGDGNWHHIALTWNATSQVYKQFVDGNLNGTGNLAPTVFGDSRRTQLGGLTRNNQFWNNSMDEVGLWNRTLNNQEVINLYNAGNGESYNQIIITAPIITSNQKNLTIYVNDTSNNVASQFTSWDYKVFENSMNYSSTVLSSYQTNFILNLTLNSSVDLSSAKLVYNGTEVSPTITSSGQDRIISVIGYVVPSVSTNTNLSFYWNLVLNDLTEINTSILNQTILEVSIDNCSVNPNKIFNLSLFDEQTKSPLIGDIQVVFQLLNTFDYSVIATQSYSVTNINNISICSAIDLSGQNLAYSAEIRYTSSGYASEFYNIQRKTLPATADNINLYDLNSSASTQFKITYQDSTFNFVDDAVIQLQRQYITGYETVEAPTTSSDGITIVHIDLNSVKYRATVVKNGIVLDEFDNLVFKCQSELTGECSYALLGKIDPQNDNNYDNTRDFYYSEPVLTNSSITISFSIPSGAPSLVNIVLQQKDQFDNKTLCNKTITSSAGSISCDYSATLGASYIELLIYKNGVPMAIKTYIIPSINNLDWLGNNYIFILVLLLSLVGMALSSPEWIVINGIITMVIAGGLYLASGLDFVTGLGNIIWLVIAGIILITKMSKQEDR